MTLTKVGYAFVYTMCLCAPFAAQAQDLPPIDLPPLPSLGEGPAGLPPLPDASPAPAPAAEVTLPTIEVISEQPQAADDLPPLPDAESFAENPIIEPVADVPPLPHLLPESQNVSEPVEVSQPEPSPFPDLAGDDPFADPEFDALFNDEKPEEKEVVEPKSETAAPGLPPLPGQQVGNVPPVGLPALPGAQSALPPIGQPVAVEEPAETERPVAKQTPKRKAKPFNYKVQRLPAPIYQRAYNGENRHLPTARFESDMDHEVFMAAAHDNVNGLRALLNDGRRIDMRNPQGDTPLITAVRANAMKSARLLVARGADVHVRNRYGQTAMDVARQQRNKEALILLAPLTLAQN